MTETTPEMRARIRELASPPRDDVDRAVLALLADFEATARAPGDAGERARIDLTKRVPEALECPFCGADDPLAWLSHDATPNSWAVFCQVCEAEGPHGDTEAGAISQWNNRIITAALQSERTAAASQARRETIEECARLCDEDAAYWKAECEDAYQRRLVPRDGDETEDLNRGHEHAAAMAAHSRMRAAAIRALAAPQESA